MSEKISNLSLVKVGGNSRTYRAGWSIGTKNLVAIYIASEGGTKKTYKRTLKSATKEYEVTWQYDVYDSRGQLKRITQSKSTTKSTNATFNAPAEAINVNVSVRPVPLTYKAYKATTTVKKTAASTKTTKSTDKTVSKDNTKTKTTETVYDKKTKKSTKRTVVKNTTNAKTGTTKTTKTSVNGNVTTKTITTVKTTRTTVTTTVVTYTTTKTPATVERTTKWTYKDTNWYTAASTSKTISTGVAVPNTPTISNIEMDGRKIIVTVTSDDPYVSKYYLYVYVNGKQSGSRRIATTVAGSAKFTISNCAYSSKYSFAAQILNTKNRVSKVSSKSASYLIIPANPKKAPTFKADGDGGRIYFETAPSYVTSVEVEYVQADSLHEAKDHFWQGTVTTGTTILKTHFMVEDMEAGKKYFFRYQFVNDTGPSTGWSPINSQAFIYGTPPDAPTVWNSKAIYLDTERAVLNWVHNSTDDAVQSAYQITYTVNGGTSQTISGTTASSYSMDLSEIEDGSTVRWNVRTLGIATAGWSPRSETQSFKVWQQPTVIVDTNDVVSRFPLVITADTNSPTQRPIVIDIEIRATDEHVILQPDGNERLVQPGDVIYSSHNNTSADPYVHTIAAGDLFLTDSHEYEAYAACVMNSGLSCEDTTVFTYDVSEPSYSLGALIDEAEGYAVSIVPYAVTAIGEPTEEGDMLANATFARNVVFSVFRFETDGTYTALVKDLPNDGMNSYLDKHAALGAQSYRIIAYDKNTGYVSYSDEGTELLDEGCIIISWDSNKIGAGLLDEAENPTDDSESLVLPYNIEINEQHSPDMAGVDLIGQIHPLGTYGTQLGETAQWTCEILKDDYETIAKLRELSRIMKDVYVREPTGNGYYAMVALSMRSSHDSWALSVSFTITRTNKIDECMVM